MIDGLFKNGHVEEAMALLQSLERDKYELNIEVYSLVIDGCAEWADWKKLERN